MAGELMRRLIPGDLATVVSRFEGASERSLFALSTVFGYSRSELEVWLASPNCRLFVDAASGLLVDVAEIDREQAMARVQVCGTGEIEPVQRLLAELQEGLMLDRLYSYVFPWESDEIGLLLDLGYVREASFREHLYVRGGFQDIEVYGRAATAP